MKLTLPAALTTRAARSVLVTQKHSPAILFAAGVVGVGATVVLACRATLKLEDHLTDAEKDIQVAEETLKVSRTSLQYRKDMTAIYVTHAVRITKLYAPAIIVGVGSVAALTGSHKILNNRNASLTAAYAVTEKAFKEYRQRVVSELGEDKDREFRFGSKETTIVTEDLNGPKKHKEKTHAVGAEDVSQYARLWGKDTSSEWSNVDAYNHLILKTKQNHMNDLLRLRGHISLNDVYDELGLDRTKAGYMVGWVKDNPNGDGYIDFGCFDGQNMNNFANFVMGLEDHILLDFNVDGVILDLI